ncbi:hypothetical protein DERP_007979 [Dermatophagoides pteronyssinus]|uniref:Secreted protein n=1 Tax=Dermatophagoides pteronyssinus TaxID=6956 RepID=A0ABQ8ITG6_DERPT|nr:hypothetical protein DERP_007979 [Dermatophagoides pteronyssinus]
MNEVELITTDPAVPLLLLLLINNGLLFCPFTNISVDDDVPLLLVVVVPGDEDDEMIAPLAMFEPFGSLLFAVADAAA